MPRVVRSADITQALRGFEGERAPRAGDDDEVDLASLVQRTDELEGGGRIRRDTSDAPVTSDDDADDGGWGSVP